MLRGIGAALTDARLGLVALALGLHVVGLLLTGERWRIVISALGRRLPFWHPTLINLAGNFVRNVTPAAGLGGDATRIALLGVNGIPLGQATAAFAYVRLTELPSLACVVLLSMTAFAAVAGRSSRALAGVAAVTTLAAVGGWLARRHLAARLADLRVRTAHLTIDRRSAATAVFYAALTQAETIARQIAVAAAFGVPLTIQQSAAILGLTIVGGMAPTIGSLGAIEGTLIGGLMMFGVPAEAAIAITLVERAISYVFSSVVGAAALAFLGGRTLLGSGGARTPFSRRTE